MTTDTKHIETLRQIADYIELRPHAVAALQAAIAALEEAEAKKDLTAHFPPAPEPRGYQLVDVTPALEGQAGSIPVSVVQGLADQLRDLCDTQLRGISALRDRDVWREVQRAVHEATPARAEAQGAVAFDDWPDFHPQGMGCGLEDRGITDRYEAMRYGWDEALDRVAERIRHHEEHTHPQQEAEDARRYRESLESVIQYGSDTLSGQFVEREDRAKWYRDGVKEMVRRARAAMSRGSDDA